MGCTSGIDIVTFVRTNYWNSMVYDIIIPAAMGLKTDRHYNDHKKKDKQRSTKHYTKTKIEQHEVHTNRV
jgi:hypothetical protein